MGLNPQNSDDFEAILLSFSDILAYKPFDNTKLEERRPTYFGVVDALTTNLREGVCTDYATWIAEMMSLTNVNSLAGGDFKRVVSTVSHVTIGAGHSMGRIRDPNTGEYYTVNYSQIIKIKDGSLVPFDQVVNDIGFGFTNAGIMIYRGEIQNENGKVTTAEDQMSGVLLTPFGKEIQNLVYDDKTFENLKIQAVIGVMRSQKTREHFQIRITRNRVGTLGLLTSTWEVVVESA
ncbi:MAG: hypothetical protein KA715_12420 [Xanthomonadaceae bacterium]|nr:hypothetical protein [Xanthomonadaceae bacterium]